MRFGDFIGNKHNVEVLQSELKSRRLASAYLFSGREGIGKCLLALTVAKALHCKETQKTAKGFFEPCGKCSGCAKVIHRTHPDLFFISPDGKQIKIEQIRNLQARLQYLPLESTRKVVIIDEADSMNTSAANALLRTLEEPPQGTIFFLISTSSDALLPTVRSRCRHLRFSPLSQEDIEAWLAKNLEDAAGKDLSLIAHMAEGSLSGAIALSKQDIKEQRAKLIDGLLSLDHLDASKIFKLAQVFGKEIEDEQTTVGVLKSWYRDLYLFNSLQMDKFVVNKDCVEGIGRQALRFSSEDLWGILREVESIESSLVYNASLQIGLERLFFKVNEILGRST